MKAEPLRFKKSSRSGTHTDCVELAHTLTAVRDSKNGGLLTGVDVRGLVTLVRASRAPGRR